MYVINTTRITNCTIELPLDHSWHERNLPSSELNIVSKAGEVYSRSLVET